MKTVNIVLGLTTFTISLVLAVFIYYFGNVGILSFFESYYWPLLGFYFLYLFLRNEVNTRLFSLMGVLTFFFAIVLSFSPDIYLAEFLFRLALVLASFSIVKSL